MSEHVVRVGALNTDVAVVAAPAAVPPLRARLDRTLCEVLPPLLAEVAGPLLDRHAGVVRLRHLRVRLDHAGPFDEATLARLLAREIASALAETLAHRGPDVQVWEDHEAYLAAYVEMLLGLEPGPSWPFAEFSALTLLSPAEAVVEVLRVRPSVLARLARHGANAGNPAALLGPMDHATCAALLDAVLDTAPRRPTTATDVAAALEAPAAQPAGPDEVPRAALATLLRTLALTPGTGVTPLLRAAVAVSALATLPPPSRAVLTQARHPQELQAAPPPGVSMLPPRVRTVLLEALTQPATRTALAGLPGPSERGRRLRDAVDVTGDGHERTAGRRRGTPTPELASPVAGAALLLPGVARYALHRTLAPPQLRAAVLATLGEEARFGTATDPLLAALLPADPHREVGELPPVPPDAVDALPAASRGRVASPAGAHRWGELLLADFADRLPGLAGSSPAYLRRQFLHTPGRLDLTDDAVTVTLEGPPLAVVLAMAGLHGHQGPLPHLQGRQLTLVLTGLRR